ncbi:3-oxoadipate enol-lactonase [Paracidovorax oryzae]|uniref:3-oxoadipate enol-lactonase n=1 Tax=Paracidovorax oryzae TaxID=862720 RepID=UPI0002E3D44E|nr:3-oxoadipate enol-lactonase [Paracidovorax oryzae]
MQRNAEYQKIANKFAYQWKAAYDQYYQRNGGVIGDCQQAPTYMVNGSETSFGGAAAVCNRAGGAAKAGIPENFTNTGLKVCNGQGYAKDQVGAGDAALATQNLRELFSRIGVRMPPGRGEGQEDRYLYQDSNGNAAELQVCFQWNPPGTASGAGNVMVLRGLTPDLARFLDQVIDGKPDSREGRFRIQGRTAHLERLVVANSAAKIGTADGWTTRAAMVREKGAAGMAELAASSPGRWFTDTFAAAQPDVVRRAQGWIAGIAPEGYAGCCEALAQADLRAAIGGIAVPTLLIAGTADPVTTVADAQAMQAAINGARVAELPASHLSNLEAPQAFDAALADFLQRD